MPSRVKDINGARQLEIDATSHPGSVFLAGKGFHYEFDRGLFMAWLSREGLLMDLDLKPLVIACSALTHSSDDSHSLCTI